MAVTAATPKTDSIEDLAHFGDRVLEVSRGRVIYQIPEEDMPSDLLMQYQAKAAAAYKQKSGGIDEHAFLNAAYWLIMRIFNVDGQKITIDHLTAKPSQSPDALGARAVAKLNTLAQEVANGVPEGKE